MPPSKDISADARAIVASNLTAALAVLVTAGWGADDKEHKHPSPQMVIGDWYEEFLEDLGESK
jgi:hypothetical protein